jgi:bacillithiol system protein YtxJ
MSHVWKNLEQIADIDEIAAQKGYQLIFKHSTRCSVSGMAKKRFEQDWDCITADMPIYLLDLLRHRDISAAIAERFQVHHESPQIILLKDGECVLDASHSNISAEEVQEVIVG